MKSKITNEYVARNRDKAYVENKKKLQYLHEKLSHIKTLVHQYDKNATSLAAK